MSERVPVADHSAATDAAPYDWALALVAARVVAPDAERDQRADAALLANTLRQHGYLHTAAAVEALHGMRGPLSAAKNPTEAAEAVANADAALAALVASRRQPLIPSVNTTASGVPRVVLTGPDTAALARTLQTECGPHGVDAELRLFLDEALAAGDVVVDAAPGAGFAALTAATFREPVSVMTLHDTEAARASLDASAASVAALHERDGHTPTLAVRALPAQPLDALAFPDMPRTAYVVLHCGDASQVAPTLVGARMLQRTGRLGVVAWSRAARDAVDTATTVLDVLGYQHFALADGAEGVELVPAHVLGGSEMVFSISPEFLSRAEHESDVGGASVRHSGTDVAAVSGALFDAVQENLTPGARELGRIPTPGELAVAQLDAWWDGAQVVSFDIFDTLLVRKVAAPSDVFLHLVRYAPFAQCGRTAASLAEARQHAEELARRAGYASHGSTEVPLASIHTALAPLVGLSAADVPAMVEAERAIERALCEAHPVLAAWFARAQRDGKVVWCISDTYHDRAFLTELLTHCGFAMAGVRVFSSADAQCSKSDGTLFQRLLRTESVRASDLLHVGDHAVGDGAMAQAHGIASVVHPWGAARPDDTPCTEPGDAVALGVAMIGARTAEPALPFWWRFGYSVAGPVLAGFAFWLRARFTQDGIDRAYFLLRDGEILETVYRLVNAAVPSGAPVATALLESSRRAFLLPAFEAAKPTLWSQLTATENARPAREFLERMAVDAEPHRAAFRAAGFASLDEIVDPRDRASLGRIATVLRHADVDAALRTRAHEERAPLLAYLEQEGVLAGGRVALVDVGWNGTIQKSLVAMLDLEQRAHDLAGYYLGTLAPAHVDVGQSQVAGYLFEAGMPGAHRRAVLQLPQLLEFVCSTTRGSLRGFTRADGRVVPVHGAVDHDDDQQAAHTAMREGVLAYTARVAAECAASGIDAVQPGAALRRLARVIERPTAEEAAHIGALRHAEGLAADRGRTLASFTPGAWSIDSVLADQSAAYWPAGLRAQRTPQALVLRAAQWLAEAEAE
jgi:FMN phosphatase YigB (HAD superfamily)